MTLCQDKVIMGERMWQLQQRFITPRSGNHSVAEHGASTYILEGARTCR